METFNIDIETSAGMLTMHIEAITDGPDVFYIGYVRGWNVIVEADSIEAALTLGHRCLEMMIEWKQEELLQSLKL